MVAKPARKRATYQDVIDAPENMVAEIIDGELLLASRPKGRHARNYTTAGAFLTGAFEFGLNGPGGWKFVFEPELHWGPAERLDVLVPDIAGWREERFVDSLDGYFHVVPDWICEVASPSTAHVDRMKKMPLYARQKVSHVWLPDPKTWLVDVFRFEKTRYSLVGTYGGNDAIRAEPFEEVEIPPAFFWGAAAPPPDESASKPVKKRASGSKKKR